ncbi:DUF4468 domain-containing protein [Spirosoma sp.]|uniref:DUF4468 domain-containing protein n=1 Tax=Spirosoma sp. TaxID=1899569 RepID=UPI003B3B043A
MKKFFTLLLLSSLAGSCVPTFKMFEKDGKLLGVLPLVNGRVLYRETIQTPELPKEEVFRRARRWWVDNYRSAKDVFQLVDKDTGEIVGKGWGNVYTGKGLSLATHHIFHVISFDVSEDEYTVTVYGLQIENDITRQYFKSKNQTSAELPIERFNIGTVKYAQAIFTEIDQETRLTLKYLNGYIKKQNSTH